MQNIIKIKLILPLLLVALTRFSQMRNMLTPVYNVNNLPKPWQGSIIFYLPLAKNNIYLCQQ